MAPTYLPQLQRHFARSALAFAGLLAFAAPALAFDLEDVAKRAESLASADFVDPGREVPDWLVELPYDQWRDIRFRPERSLWRESGLPFEVQLFHAGLFYEKVVRVNEIDAKGVRPVVFSPAFFDYGKNTFASRVPYSLGFAGFRLHYPIKTASYKDEVIVFLGASYFRAVGRDQGFGLSARGLAIDTALPSGEEFPSFREFWLEKPRRGATALTLYALLDSRSVAGAYRFVVHPGVQTRTEVEMRLFFRRPVRKLGIAPLTSMFFFGENHDARFSDYRPEVHDSDGLMIETAQEWLWRPLANPVRLRGGAFLAQDPKGFGLVQRDRSFDHYQDLETRADLRPSTWVTTQGDWGVGHVELVEIPTESEMNDNIVAFWVPRRRADSVQPLRLAYDLSFYGEDPERPPLGRVVASRMDQGTYEDAVRYVIDFEGKRLASLTRDTVVQSILDVGHGGRGAELLEQQLIANPVTGGFRLVFQLRPIQDEPVDLRAYLRLGSEVLTETWADTLER